MKKFSSDPRGDYIRVSSNINKLEPMEILPYTPEISKEDRVYGEITRYFARFITHSSSSDIIEINQSTYAKLKKNDLYQTSAVRWKISGPLDDKMGLTNITSSTRLSTGIMTANKMSVELCEEELPGLKEYITDYKKFWIF
jgi:hypothetical protein